jgi:hypothetical protein
MVRFFTILLVYLLVSIVGQADARPSPRETSASESKSAPKKKKDNYRGDFRIFAPVWVTGNGESLPTENLTAKVGARDLKVRGGRLEESPLLLFVAIDFSDDLILTESAKTALASAVQSVAPNVYTSLLRIPEQPMVITDPSVDRDAFVAALRTLPMSGRAGFFEMVDVVSGVTEPVVRSHPVRAAVLYLTDSEISNYRTDYTNPVINSADSRDLSRRFPDALIREKVSTLTNTLLQTSVPIFVVHLRYRSDTLNEAYQTGLRRLSEATGGQAVFCRSIAEIPESITNMVNTIQKMNVLEIEVPANVNGSFVLSLENGTGSLQYRTLFQRPR